MGMPKADFSKSKAAVTVNLPAGIATAFTGKDGTISTEAPMLRGENGFTVHSLLTTGETLQETNGVFNPSTAASYTPVGRFDGIGAFKSDSGTVRVLVNHEIGSAAGYTISDGGSGRVSLDGARISYFDIDTKTMATVSTAG